ncbi:MAG: PIG-L family deacetylase [Gemmatimonadota bacterium]|nr:PIG-L family deacetylase [Gemmatimonadota bacterium]
MLSTIQAETRAAKAVPDPARVLLIEDDESQARAMSRWMEITDRYEVTHAASGYSAEAFLRSGVHWDIVVSDIDLPGMSGLEILELCKKLQPQAPVLMVTAHKKFDYALRAIRGQADDFLVKPMRRATLQQKLDELLEKSRQKANARPKEVVVAIGAHPDDVEIGCGGILLNHSRHGDDVIVVTLTGGEAGGAPDIRHKESREAARALGAELRMFDLPDRSISPGPETISAIESVLRDFHPSIIYTHTAHDAHQDHRAVHAATMVAARGVPNVYCYQSPSTTVDFRPSLFVDVEEQMDRKLDIIGLFASQASIRPYLEPSHLRSTASYWGRFSDYRVVEPLEVIRRSA